MSWDPRLPALSIWPPRGSMVVDGRKWIEARSKPTSHRGLVAIHSTLRACEDDDPIWQQTTPGTHWDVRGSIIGVACLVDCLPMYASNGASRPKAGLDTRSLILYRRSRPAMDVSRQAPLTWVVDGMFAYVLDAARPLPNPIPMPGGQGVWRVPREATAHVLSQLT